METLQICQFMAIAVLGIFLLDKMIVMTIKGWDGATFKDIMTGYRWKGDEQRTEKIINCWVLDKDDVAYTVKEKKFILLRYVVLMLINIALLSFSSLWFLCLLPLVLFPQIVVTVIIVLITLIEILSIAVAGIFHCIIGYIIDVRKLFA